MIAYALAPLTLDVNITMGFVYIFLPIIGVI